MRLAPQEIRTFFITSVAHERRAVLQTNRMAQLLLEVLEDNRSQSRFLLHEYVIMPNHFHLLITPAHEIPLEKAVQFIKGGFSYRAKKELGYRFDVWAPGFTQHRIKDAEDYETHRVYIHENPVRGGLARTPEEYPYSSAHPGALVDPCPPALKRFSTIPFSQV